MKLFDYGAVPNPRRARMAFAEKGMPVELVQVDLRAGEQLRPEYLKLNPQGTVPLLQLDDGQTISENIAIVTYLEAIQPEPPLLGVGPLEKARVQQWNSRLELEFLLPIAEAFRNSHPSFAGRALVGPEDYAQIPALAERGRNRVEHFWDVLDSRLRGQAFLAGEHFSFADITALVATEFARVVRLSPPDRCVNLRRWHNALRERPSYTA